MRVTGRWLVPGVVVVLLATVGAALVFTATGRTAAGALSRRAVNVLERFGPGRAPPPSSVTISIDATRGVRSISPLIYGVAHANPDQLLALGATLNRWGGNPNTRYN